MSRSGLYFAPDYYNTAPTSAGTSTGSQATKSATYEKKKAAKARAEHFHQRVADFVKTTVLPGLKSIADEFDRSIDDARESAHLAMPLAAKQRELRLWDAVMSVSLKESSSWHEAQSKASETYRQLQPAIEASDWDDEQLAMYESVRLEMEATRRVDSIPKTDGKATRATLLEVGRAVDQCSGILQTLWDHTKVEFLLIVSKGASKYEFEPQILASSKAERFVEIKLGMSTLQLARDMEGYAVYGEQNVRDANGEKSKPATLVTSALREKLRDLVEDDSVKLKWKHYDSLCQKHDVELVGWPEEIAFGRIHMLSDKKCETLFKLISGGTLYWRKKEATPTAPDNAHNMASEMARPPLTPPPTQEHPRAMVGEQPYGPGRNAAGVTAPVDAHVNARVTDRSLVPQNTASSSSLLNSTLIQPVPVSTANLLDPFADVPLPFTFPDPNIFPFDPSQPFIF